MTHFKSIMLAGAIAVSGVITATDADALGVSLSGTFNVEIFQADNTGNTDDTADATFANAFGAARLGSATYTGIFDFGTKLMDDSTTIDQWLKSAGGSYSETAGNEFDENRTISSPNINADPPTARTTWFVFTGTGPGGEYSFLHDDGIQFCGDALVSNACPSTLLVDAPNPTSENPAGPVSFGGGDFSLVYAATNGDPSILKVNVVPLPAAAWLLLGVSGALVAAKRRSARRAA